MHHRLSQLVVFILLFTALPLLAEDLTPKEIKMLKLSFARPKNISYPSNNRHSAEKEKLGKILFFDPRLSGNNHISCASCHKPELSWTDGLPKAVGVRTGPRRTPTLLNLANSPGFFWDSRAQSLEEQALGPIQSPEEMNQNLKELVKEIKAVPEYVELFENAFPKKAITAQRIAQALATFVRSLVSSEAPFDRWLQGDETALSEEAKKGFALFATKGRCTICHSTWAFTNYTSADTGLPDKDVGMGKFDKSPYVQHLFKTPTLRNAAVRGPFMHDGSLATIDDVIEHYNKGGQVKRISLSADVVPLGLSPDEKIQLKAFLLSLVSQDPIPTVTLPRELATPSPSAK